MADAKPGRKTSEFWLSFLAVVFGFVLAGGFVAEDSTTAKVVGGALAVLAGLGYTMSRTNVKVEEAVKEAEQSKAASYVEWARAKVEELKAARAAKEDATAADPNAPPSG